MTTQHPWIAALAFGLLAAAACTGEPETAEPDASPPAAAAPDANAKARSAFAMKARAAQRARAAAQDPEQRKQQIQDRQQRVAQRRNQRFANLGLTEDQKQRIQAIRVEQQTWREDHRDELSELGEQRRVARESGDDAAANAIRLQLRELRESMPTEQDVVAVLTEEQRAQLRAKRPGFLGRSPRRLADPPSTADDSPDATAATTFDPD